MAEIQEKASEALVPKAQSDLIKPEPQAGKLSRLAAFTPTNLTEAIALSKLIANSELAPKDFKGKPANVLIAMQMGAEVGLAPMAAIQNIAVINGRPSIWGDAALAIVQNHPDYEWHKEWWEGEGDDRKAVFQIKRKGHELHVSFFTVFQAKKAGLWNKEGPWRNYPDRMLQMRARSFGMRDKFADALRGLNIAEEVMDIPPDTSPAKQRREEAALDVESAITSLTPSQEPNRGHEDTGLQRRKGDDQPAPKPDKVMCSECRQIDSHSKDCKFYDAKAEQDRKTSKPTSKAAYLILDTEQRTKNNAAKTPFLLLNVVNPENVQGKLYCWHQSFAEYLKGVKDKPLVCEISQQNTNQGKIYFQLEHIFELGGVKFVNDKPAETAKAPVEVLEDDFALEE